MKIEKLDEVRHIITMQCNLECLHCYLKAGGEENNHKNKIISEDILDDFYLKYQPNVVSATGGEPLMNIQMVYLLGKVVNKYGGALEVVTNGTLINEEFVQKIIEINPHTFFQISLDGLENYHNYLRNSKTAYFRAINGINILSKYNVRTKIRFTATNENYQELPELINLLESMNNPNIELVIRPVVHTGRAKTNNLKFEHDYKLLDTFKSDKIKISTTDNEGKCGCGVNTVAIDNYGDIYPCNYTVGNPNYYMGNLEKNNYDLEENEEFKNFTGKCYARHLQMFSVQK